MAEVKLERKVRPFFIVEDVPKELIFREAICSFCGEYKTVRNFSNFNFSVTYEGYDFQNPDITGWTICRICFDELMSKRYIIPKGKYFSIHI